MTQSHGPRTLVMGVVNVTDDSFSDGGRYLDPARAVEHALALVAQGASIIDVGGESTRPPVRCASTPPSSPPASYPSSKSLPPKGSR